MKLKQRTSMKISWMTIILWFVLSACGGADSTPTPFLDIKIPVPTPTNPPKPPDFSINKYPGLSGKIIFIDEVYIPKEELDFSTMFIVNADGSGLKRLTTDSEYKYNLRSFSTSPDGNYIVFHGEGDRITTMKSDGSEQSIYSEIVYPRGDGERLFWFPDNQKIIFYGSYINSRGFMAPLGIYTIIKDSSGLTLLKYPPLSLQEISLSPDGQKIAFVSGKYNKNNEIYVMNSDGANIVQLTNDGTPHHWYLSWSPDGQKIGYRGNGYFVMNVDGSKKTPLSLQPGIYGPFTWSPDGRTIVIGEEVQGLTAINLDNYEQRKIFEVWNNDYDWSPDGKKIVVSSGCSIYIINYDGSDPFEFINGCNNQNTFFSGVSWTP